MSDTEKTINVSGNAIWSNGVPITADSLNNIEARLNATSSYKEKIFITLFDTKTTIHFKETINLSVPNDGGLKVQIPLIDLSKIIANIEQYHLQYGGLFVAGNVIDTNIPIQLGYRICQLPYVNANGKKTYSEGDIYIKNNEIYAECILYTSADYLVGSTTISLNSLEIYPSNISLLFTPKSLFINDSINETNINITSENIREIRKGE